MAPTRRLPPQRQAPPSPPQPQQRQQQQPQQQSRAMTWQEEALRQRQQYLQRQQLQQEEHVPHEPQQKGERRQGPQRGGSAGAAETDKGDPHALKTGLALTWLGTNSGSPTLERNVSCTLVRLAGATQMVDCGEGTTRQLLSLPAVQLAEVDGIFITHLHGDHCFGLASTLALLDEAKAAGQADPARRRNHVYGPPGLVELLRASLVLTGAVQRLQLPLTVTEFVCSPASAHPPRPLEEALSGRRPQQGQQQQGKEKGQQGPAAAEGGKVFVQRLAPKHVRDTPELQAAVDAVSDRIDRLEEIWAPPRNHPLVRARLERDAEAEAYAHSSADEEADEQNAPLGGNGSGWRPRFVAAEGLFWEVPGAAGVAVRAAQLQHRVACWGYVFRELAPAEEGAKRRKVVVLGDTVSSRAIAPLAAGCDVLSHEATFAAGMEEKARIAQHSTGRMAGAFAAAVGAKQLVLTHFSARYREGPRDNETRNIRLNSQRELEQQSWAVTCLLREAAGAFRRPDAIFAACDFYTHHVPISSTAAGAGTAAPPPPRPAGAVATGAARVARAGVARRMQ